LSQALACCGAARQVRRRHRASTLAKIVLARATDAWRHLHGAIRPRDAPTLLSDAVAASRGTDCASIRAIERGRRSTTRRSIGFPSGFVPARHTAGAMSWVDRPCRRTELQPVTQERNHEDMRYVVSRVLVALRRQVRRRADRLNARCAARATPRLRRRAVGQRSHRPDGLRRWRSAGKRDDLTNANDAGFVDGAIRSGRKSRRVTLDASVGPEPTAAGDIDGARAVVRHAVAWSRAKWRPLRLDVGDRWPLARRHWC